MISFLKNKYIFFLLISVQFIGFDITAQKIVLTNDLEVMSISSELLVYEDKNSEYTINEVLTEKINVQFKSAHKIIPSYSFTSSSIWCKFEFENKTKKESFLEIVPPFLNEIIFYTIHDNGKIDSVRCGSIYPKKEQEISSGDYTFKLSSDAKVFYLKIKTNTRLYIIAKVGTDKAFLHKNNIIDLIKGIYGGVLLMIFLYNLFLFLSSNDRIYLYYLLHLINTTIGFLYLSGIGKEFIWSEYLWVNEHIITIMSIGFVFPIMFTINYLDTKVHSVKLHTGMLISIAVLVVNAIIDLFGLHLLAGKLLNLMGLLIITFVTFTTVVIKKKGYKPAAPFLYAWIFYFVGIFIQLMQGMNIIPTMIITSNAMQVGSMFEVIILSLAVGYKINYFRNKMQISIVGEKKALEEKEYLISQQSEELEALAQQQSQEIHDKNTKLNQKNTEIKERNKKIKEQNKELIASNKLLENKSTLINEQHESLIFHEHNLKELIESRTYELEQATRKAEEADNQKTAFLKNVSHEIRTPMNAIAGFASLLFDIDKEDKRHAYYVDIITKNTDDLLNLIDNIIELSRIQTGSVKIKYVTFDPSKVFKALNDLFKEKMKEERKSFVSLKLSIPAESNLRIRTDYNRFWQIIFHLLDNAIKYTEKGFVLFGYKVLEDVSGETNLQVFVKDTGKGIPKEKLSTVFDRFRKSEDNSTKLYSGTGLGLSLVKGLTEFMNGTIVVETRTINEFPDDVPGTSFTIIFKDIIV